MSKIIDKLTPEQEALVSVYTKKWLDSGYNTQPLNIEEATKSINWLYKFSGQEKPVIVFCDSPLQAQLMVNLLQRKGMRTLILALDGTKESSAKLYSTLSATLLQKFDSQVVGALVNSLENNMQQPAIAKIFGKISEDVQGDNLEFNYIFSSLQESYWIGFYDYILNVLFPERRQEFETFNKECISMAHNIHTIIPFKGLCFASERPTSIKLKELNNQFLLHNENGACLEYKDGYKFYALNGVRMPDWVLSTPKEQLKSEDILAITNAEQRMLAMKHKGLGHFFSDLECKVIDKFETYELTLVNLNGENCEFLKMVNPSTGEIHLEGVQPGIKTVREALAWRNGLDFYIKPDVLT